MRKMTWKEREKEVEPRRSPSSSPDRPSRKAEEEDKHLARTQPLEEQRLKMRKATERTKEKLWRRMENEEEEEKKAKRKEKS